MESKVRICKTFDLMALAVSTSNKTMLLLIIVKRSHHVYRLNVGKLKESLNQQLKHVQLLIMFSVEKYWLRQRLNTGFSKSDKAGVCFCLIKLIVQDGFLKSQVLLADQTRNNFVARRHHKSWIRPQRVCTIGCYFF